MLTFDDKYTPEDFGLIALLDHEHPMTPEFERKTMHVPVRSGQWDFGSEIKAKTFNLPLGLKDIDRIRLQQKLNSFVAFLHDEFGQQREIKMTFDYEPDKFYMVKLASAITPERLINFSRFILPFVADDGYKFATANQYDPELAIYYGQVEPGDYYDNPQSFKWQYERHYSGINNYSSLNADFAIEIVGTVTNPSVTNLNTNQTLTLPSINNGKIVIDGKRFVVIKDGQDILEGSNYNFFHIQPGEVGFLFEGENPSAIVNYRWLHKFM